MPIGQSLEVGTFFLKYQNLCLYFLCEKLYYAYVILFANLFIKREDIYYVRT